MQRPILIYIIIHFDIYQNGLSCTSKQGIFGFQFALAPLPPFRNLLFMRDSGWNLFFASQMTHLSSPNLTPRLLKCLWFAGQMPVVRGAEV